MQYDLEFSESYTPSALRILSDHSLVAAAQGGVHPAYVELCMRHREMVFRTVQRITRNPAIDGF